MNTLLFIDEQIELLEYELKLLRSRRDRLEEEEKTKTSYEIMLLRERLAKLEQGK